MNEVEKKIHRNPIVFDGNFYESPNAYRARMQHDANAVCAIKYLDPDRRHYETKTYRNAAG